MRRDLHFVSDGPLALALGLDPDRLAEIDAQVGDIVDANGSIRDIVTWLNERGDLTDGEWTSAMFALGYYCAGRDADRGVTWRGGKR